MIPPIKLPNLAGNEPDTIKEYHLTLEDDTVVVKKLQRTVHELGQPRINIFDDGSFTVGQVPIVYRKGDSKDDDWIVEFRFKAITVHYPTNRVLSLVHDTLGGIDAKEDK